MGSKNRIWSMDLVRLFACLCVSIVHFNASVSGYNGTFVYPNSIIPNFYLENRLYLGGIGVSLFFLLTGASLMLTYQEGNLHRYFKKRFCGIYPMFWFAYGIAFICDFLIWKRVPDGNISLMGFTMLGVDGYLSVLGLLQTPFYKVGEWFLGALLLLYIIFPLMHWCLKRKPVAFPVCVLACYGGYLFFARQFGLPIGDHLFFLRIPEIMLGMLFIKYDLRHKPKLLFGITGITAWLAIVLRKQISSLTLCVAVCMLLFAILVWLGEKITGESVKAFLSKAAGLTYPIFLIHHWLIDRMVIGFNLANMAKRDVVMLFVIYIFLTIFLANWLSVYTGKIVTYIKKLFAMSLRSSQ